MNVLRLIIEKGRICQWLVILGAIFICFYGGSNGWLKAKDIVEIMKYAFIISGGIELIKLGAGKE